MVWMSGYSLVVAALDGWRRCGLEIIIDMVAILELLSFHTTLGRSD
jgi:hypothetical protein